MSDKLTTLEIVRGRLANGRTIADSDVHKLVAEIDRLRAGLLRVMQYENKCDQTGQPCRSPDRCACSLEAETWCEGDGT